MEIFKLTITIKIKIKIKQTITASLQYKSQQFWFGMNSQIQCAMPSKDPVVKLGSETSQCGHELNTMNTLKSVLQDGWLGQACPEGASWYSKMPP
jgi:hypothetical protein